MCRKLNGKGLMSSLHRRELQSRVGRRCGSPCSRPRNAIVNGRLEGAVSAHRSWVDARGRGRADGLTGGGERIFDVTE